MTAAPGRRDLVTCRACGAELGTLNRQHDRVTLRPGIAVCVELKSGGVDVVCPNPTCGEYRVLKAGTGYRGREAVLSSGATELDGERDRRW